MEIPLPSSPASSVVKLALKGISCDLPAVRKVCGFSSFSAILGCSKCLYKFKSSSFGQKLDYSGFDRHKLHNWPPRTLAEQKDAATQYAMAKSPAEQKRVLSKLGVRYLDLPYFDPIRFHVIAPMHNLLL